MLIRLDAQVLEFARFFSFLCLFSYAVIATQVGHADCRIRDCFDELRNALEGSCFIPFRSKFRFAPHALREWGVK